MKKRKFTWLDGLVILVVLALLAGTGMKFLFKETTAVTDEENRFQYQLEIQGIRQVTVDSLSVGDTLYDNSGKGEVGTIVDVQAVPARTTIAKDDGTLVDGTIEDRYDVVLTVEAEGEKADGYYQIGTYDIKVNNLSTYFTKYSVWSATVISLN